MTGENFMTVLVHYDSLVEVFIAFASVFTAYETMDLENIRAGYTVIEPQTAN